MSSVTHYDYLAQQEYYQDQRRAAKRFALVRLAQGKQGKRRHLTSKALSWLGSRLISWGSNLQKQYDTVVSSSMSHSTNPVASP